MPKSDVAKIMSWSKWLKLRLDQIAIQYSCFSRIVSEFEMWLYLVDPEQLQECIQKCKEEFPGLQVTSETENDISRIVISGNLLEFATFS